MFVKDGTADYDAPLLGSTSVDGAGRKRGRQRKGTPLLVPNPTFGGRGGTPRASSIAPSVQAEEQEMEEEREMDIPQPEPEDEPEEEEEEWRKFGRVQEDEGFGAYEEEI